MAIKRHLTRWVDAGLLSPTQAQGIADFEAARAGPTLSYAVLSVAALAMGIGLVSIVAANWDLMPGRLKLGIDLVLVAALGHAVTRWRARGPTWRGETAIAVLYGLVLASIALVGQVYQFGAGAAAALAVWSGLTFLLMAMASSPQLGLLWLLGLQATYAASSIELGEWNGQAHGMALASIYWPPLLCLGLARWPWLRGCRPHWVRVLSAAGWAELVVCASLGTLAFYQRPELARPAFWFGALVSLGATVGLGLTTPASRSGPAVRGLLVAAFATSHLPLLIPHHGWPIAAALSFMGLWAVVALAAYRAGLPWVLHLSTAVIGLRLVIVYFEVFGSLLDTGLGLFGGGVLLLLLSWLWAQKRRDLEQGVPPRATPSEESRR